MTEENILEDSNIGEGKLEGRNTKKHIDIKTLIGIIGLILTPIMSYVLFETVTKNITKISPQFALLNILWFFIVYLLIFALSGSSRVTISIGTTFFYVVSAAEYFVVAFRSKPIMIWEVLELDTAMSVAGTYDFVVSRRMIAIAVFLIAYNIFMWRFYVRIQGKKKRLVIGGGCTAAAIAGMMCFYKVVVPKKGLEINQWYIKECYEERGFVLCSAVLAKYFMMDPPEGYSDEKLNEIYDSLITEMDAGADPDGIRES